jgi:hypothetical protein
MLMGESFAVNVSAVNSLGAVEHDASSPKRYAVDASTMDVIEARTQGPDGAYVQLFVGFFVLINVHPP